VAPEDERDEKRLRLRTFGIAVLWAALVVLWSHAALHLSVPPRPGWDPEIARRAPPLARYDSGWYLHIAEHGYGTPPGPGEKSEHVFFPLYPLIVAGVARALSIDAFTAGIAVSTLAALAAAWLFAAEARRRLGAAKSAAPEGEVRSALLFLLLFPTAFFLLAMYAESLFLLLALLAFAAVERRRFAAAAAFGLLAGLTRAPAVALALPLGLAVLEAGPGSDPARRRRALPAILVGLAPPAGVALWMLGIGVRFGEPGLYFRIQRAWGRGVSPGEGLLAWAAALPRRLANGDATAHPAFLVDYACAVLFLVLAVYQARRRRWADASWTAGALLLPAATGISASVPRYLVVVYPAFFALAEIFRSRPLLRWIWWVGSGLLLLAATAAFVLWRWVA
jgi:hypothetical protein